MATKQNVPLLYTGSFSREQGATLNEAASGLIPMSRLLRSAVDLWTANYKWLTQQGYTPLDAARHLLAQTEKSAQAQAPPQVQPPQPQPMPPPAPMPSPFQHPPIRGAA